MAQPRATGRLAGRPEQRRSESAAAKSMTATLIIVAAIAFVAWLAWDDYPDKRK